MTSGQKQDHERYGHCAGWREDKCDECEPDEPSESELERIADNVGVPLWLRV